MLEVQITTEYLGLATSLAYLGPLYEEALQSDTYAKGPGSTVAKRDRRFAVSAMSSPAWPGVANIGTDRDWSGSNFDQANWYAFGRLAWDPDASAQGDRARMG